MRHQIPPAYPLFSARPYDQIQIIAHRGDSSNAPENTLAAFERADRLDAWIEFDVQLSADGVPVVFHDETLDRTTNGRGRLSEHTLRELKSLDAGAWFSPRYRGERIPTLMETLNAVRAMEIVELKTPPSPAAKARLLRAVGRDLRRAPRACPIVTSFDRTLVDGLRRWRDRACPSLEVNFALNLDGPPRRVRGRPWRVRGKYWAICPNKMLVTPHRVAEWTAWNRRRDLRMVYAWTADTPSEWERLRRAGVDGIMTNRPGALKKWIEAHV